MGIFREFMHAVFGKKPPMAEVEQPRVPDEWLTVKKSGIAHRFAIVPQMNPHYRHSVCGFESTADKLGPAGERQCARCRRSKGF